jgi:hypothetical protein
VNTTQPPITSTVGGVQAPVVAGEVGTLVDRILDWAGGLVNPDLHFRAEAEVKARVCVSCKSNTQWRGGCAPCVQRAERVLLSIRCGNDLPTVGEQLLGCEIHGHDNRTAVWLKDNVKRKENSPKECWL